MRFERRLVGLLEVVLISFRLPARLSCLVYRWMYSLLSVAQVAGISADGPALPEQTMRGCAALISAHCLRYSDNASRAQQSTSDHPGQNNQVEMLAARPQHPSAICLGSSSGLSG